MTLDLRLEDVLDVQVLDDWITIVEIRCRGYHDDVHECQWSWPRISPEPGGAVQAMLEHDQARFDLGLHCNIQLTHTPDHNPGSVSPEHRWRVQPTHP